MGDLEKLVKQLKGMKESAKSTVKEATKGVKNTTKNVVNTVKPSLTSSVSGGQKMDLQLFADNSSSVGKKASGAEVSKEYAQTREYWKKMLILKERRFIKEMV